MATVSELCEAIASAADMPVADVQKYARALINSGDLPKAVGRSIPQTDFYHRARLILAIAASDRPSGCVKAMRDRYEARARFGQTDLSAGEALAMELRELASKSISGFQKWHYSNIEVSRGGVPRVVFRINENIAGYSDFNQSKQVEFLGGPHIENNMGLWSQWKSHGLPVSAYIPGSLLITTAFGSREAARQAEVEVITAYNEAESEEAE